MRGGSHEDLGDMEVKFWERFVWGWVREGLVFTMYRRIIRREHIAWNNTRSSAPVPYLSIITHPPLHPTYPTLNSNPNSQISRLAQKHQTLAPPKKAKEKEKERKKIAAQTITLAPSKSSPTPPKPSSPAPPYSSLNSSDSSWSCWSPLHWPETSRDVGGCWAWSESLRSWWRRVCRCVCGGGGVGRRVGVVSGVGSEVGSGMGKSRGRGRGRGRGIEGGVGCMLGRRGDVEWEVPVHVDVLVVVVVAAASACLSPSTQHESCVVGASCPPAYAHSPASQHESQEDFYGAGETAHVFPAPILPARPSSPHLCSLLFPGVVGRYWDSEAGSVCSCPASFLHRAC